MKSHLNMEQTINLRLNYPVLQDQEDYLKKSIDQHFQNYHDWLAITPFTGNAADREAAAKWISAGAKAIDPERVSIATGGHHALLVTILSAGLQGKAIAVDAFTYPNFREIAGLMNMTLVACQGDENGMLPASLREASKKHGIKGIYLMPTVHNPTGLVMPLERRLEIVQVAEQLGLVIIEDDAYGFLSEHPPLNFAQLSPSRGWYIFSLSKPVAPGIKAAYLVAPLGYTDQIKTAVKLTISNPTSFFATYISKLMASGELTNLINRKRQEGKRRQTIIKSLLTEHYTQGHENSWHIWVGLPLGMNSDQLNLTLLDKGILVSPSTAFSPTTTENHHYIRIALGGEMDFSRVIKGVEIIKDQLILQATGISF